MNICSNLAFAYFYHYLAEMREASQAISTDGGEYCTLRLSDLLVISSESPEWMTFIWGGASWMHGIFLQQQVLICSLRPQC